MVVAKTGRNSALDAVQQSNNEDIQYLKTDLIIYATPSLPTIYSDSLARIGRKALSDAKYSNISVQQKSGALICLAFDRYIRNVLYSEGD